jgi:hypothetical protein
MTVVLGESEAILKLVILIITSFKVASDSPRTTVMLLI